MYKKLLLYTEEEKTKEKGPIYFHSMTIW